MTTIGMRLTYGWLLTAVLLSFGFGSLADSWQASIGSLAGVLALGLLAGIVTMDRDFETPMPAATDDARPAIADRHSASWWPFASSVGAAVAVVGLAVDRFLVGFGGVLIVIALVGWVSAATRDRASGPSVVELPLLVRDVPHLTRWIKALDILAIVVAALALLIGLALNTMTAVAALAVLSAVIAAHALCSSAIAAAPPDPH